MPELGPFGSVRGVPGNGHPYRDPRPIAAVADVRISASVIVRRLSGFVNRRFDDRWPPNAVHQGHAERS
jgi:hypothetical protein